MSRKVWTADRQLGAERGPNGEPSTADFQTIELLRIVDWLAEQFDDLPELIPGRGDYRALLTSGVLVRSLNVVGRLAADGAVELVTVIDGSQSTSPSARARVTASARLWTPSFL
jgi:hypothetical protein